MIVRPEKELDLALCLKSNMTFVQAQTDILFDRTEVELLFRYLTYVLNLYIRVNKILYEDIMRI